MIAVRKCEWCGDDSGGEPLNVVVCKDGPDDLRWVCDECAAEANR